MTITPQALRVYATLQSMKSSSEEDVIDAIIPFAMPVLGVMNEKVFERHLFALGLNTLYGWKVTEGVATVFEERLRAKGFLQSPGNGVRILIVKAPKDALEPQNPEYGEEIRDVVRAFQHFATGLNDLLYRERQDDDLLDLLVKFLVTLDMSADQTQVKKGTELPEMLKSLEEQGPSRMSADDRYLCARFVEASQNNPEVLPKLARLAAVGMLTEVVQDFASPSLENNQTNLTVVLDAPIALAAVGVAPKATQEDVKLTIEALKKLGCGVVVLEESTVEMSRILNSILGTERANRHGRIHMAMIKQEVKEEYVRVVAKAPDKALRSAGLDVKMMDLKSFPNLHHYFPNKEYEAFLGEIGWNPGQTLAVRHDAIVMALVTRLRENQRSSDLFESRYAFATINTRFVSLARTFLEDRNMLSNRYSPPVVRYSALSTAAWLKTGFGASSRVPVAHLLSYCERVLSVKQEVVEKARELLRAYTPDQEKQFDLLLSDARSVTRMMDLTLGDEDALDAENISGLLEEMKRATAAEVTAEFEARLLQQTTRQRQRTAELKRQIEAHAAEAAALREAVAARTAADAAHVVSIRNELDAAVQATNTQVGRVRAVIYGAVIGAAGYLWLNSALPIAPGLPLHTLNLGWVGIPLALGATYFSVMRVLQLPTLGVGNLMNAAGRFVLRRKLERAGLVRDVEHNKIKWDYGSATILEPAGELPQ